MMGVEMTKRLEQNLNLIVNIGNFRSLIAKNSKKTK